MSDISTLTLIGNTTSRPIRHTLTKEKLTNDIQNTVNHSTTPISTTPTPPDGAQARKTRAHPTRGCARDADETNNSTPVASRTTMRTLTAR